MCKALESKKVQDVLAHLSVNRGVYIDLVNNRSVQTKGVILVSENDQHWVCPIVEGGMFTLKPFEIEHGFAVSGRLASVGCINGPSKVEPDFLVDRFFVGSKNAQRAYLPLPGAV